VCKVLLLNLLPGYTVADWKRLDRIANLAIHEVVHHWQAVRLGYLPELLRQRDHS
jgi:hypothetical protein